MRLDIFCEDRVGITQDILEIFIRHEIAIQGFELVEHHLYLNFPKIEFIELQHIMPEIRLLNGVKDVKTVDFMPLEMNQIELDIILSNTSDTIIVLNHKGQVVSASKSAETRYSDKVSVGSLFTTHIKGYSVSKLLDQAPTDKLLQVAEIENEIVQTELTPIWVDPNTEQGVFTGILIRITPSPKQYPLPEQSDFLLNQVIQKSVAMKKFIRQFKKSVYLDEAIIIYGESGVGKSFFAELNHYLNASSSQKPIKIDCIKIDEVGLTQSFLNATSQQGMLLERLDLLSCDKQLHLFECMKTYEDKNLSYVSTSKVYLSYLVGEGVFNEDLYQYLSTVELEVPALRNRKEDIADLCHFLLRKISTQLGQAPISISDNALQKISKQSWISGNVQELLTSLHTAVLANDSNELEVSDFEFKPTKKNQLNIEAESLTSLDAAVKSFENSLLRQLYPTYPSTRQLAGKLNLSHTAVANKLREYGINKHTMKIIKS